MGWAGFVNRLLRVRFSPPAPCLTSPVMALHGICPLVPVHVVSCALPAKCISMVLLVSTCDPRSFGSPRGPSPLTCGVQRRRGRSVRAEDHPGKRARQDQRRWAALSRQRPWHRMLLSHQRRTYSRHCMPPGQVRACEQSSMRSRASLRRCLSTPSAQRPSSLQTFLHGCLMPWVVRHVLLPVRSSRDSAPASV